MLVCLLFEMSIEEYAQKYTWMFMISLLSSADKLPQQRQRSLSSRLQGQGVNKASIVTLR